MIIFMETMGIAAQLSLILLITNIVTTTLMCGCIWFAQLSHYPLLAFVGKEQFIAYESEHIRRISFIAWFMLSLELVTSFLLLFIHPIWINFWLLTFGFAVITLIWLSTWFWQFPHHKKLRNGFDSALHKKLVSTNWARTILWTIRFLWCLYVLATLCSQLTR